MANRYAGNLAAFARLVARACPSLYAPLVRCGACGVKTLPRDVAGHMWRAHGVRLVSRGDIDDSQPVLVVGPARRAA